jgi:hypothetical protein
MKLKKNYLQYFILFIACLLIYLPGISSKMYADDFEWVVDNPASNLFFHFFNNDPNINWYRPLACSVYAVSQALFGFNTVFVHLLQITTHFVLCAAVYNAMEMLGISKKAAIFSVLFLLSSQVGAAAINGNDTLSQVFSSCFGFLGVLYVYKYTETGSSRFYIAGIITFLFALFSKESSVVYPAIGVCILGYHYYIKEGKRDIKNFIIRSIPFVIITGFYLSMRISISQIQPEFGDDIYQFKLGLNIIKNLGLFVFSLICPVSSAAVFTAFVKRELAILLLTAFFTLVFAVIIFKGLFSRGDKKNVIIFSALTIITFFPMAMLNKVSELYAYNALPFLAILVGIGFERFYSAITSKTLKYAAAVFAGVIFLANVYAIESKISQMKANGERAEYLISQTLPFVSKVPSGGNLILLNSPSKEVEYSIYKMNGFNIFHAGEMIFNKLTKRSDIKITVADSIDENLPKGKTIVLVIRNNKVEQL